MHPLCVIMKNREIVEGANKRMYFDEIKVGMHIEISSVVIEEEKMLDFARNFDNIPLHTNPEYAASTHFGRIIAPGVMSFMSVWAKYLEADPIGDELLAGKSTKIEWMRPVFAGDVLTGSAEVTAVTPRNARNGIVEITFHVYNQAGELVLTNVTEAVVKRRQEE